MSARPIDPALNSKVLREGLALLETSKARVVRFELVSRDVGTSRALLMYHVAVERTDNVLEDPRSFFVSLAQASTFYPFVTPECLRSSSRHELPRAGYGPGDDGLRSLAPDHIEFVLSATSRVSCACVPTNVDAVKLTLEIESNALTDVLTASDAIKLGRMLVWMGQRVHMREARRAAGLMPNIDLVRDMDREKHGLASVADVEQAIESLRSGTWTASAFTGIGIGADRRYEVHMQHRDGQQGYSLIVNHTDALRIGALIDVGPH